MDALKKYSTLLFDADNTLLDFSSAEKFAITKACEKFGIPCGEEEVKLYSKINLSLWKKHEKGEITRDNIKLSRFIEFTQTVGAQTDPKAIAAFYEAALATRGDILLGADLLCKALCDSYDMYIVTNGLASVQHSRLGNSGLLPYFKKLFISEEYGSQKPEKVFFDKIFEEIPEKDKSRICIIGDSMSSDILGGINAGIDTCFFAPVGVPEPYAPTLRAYSLGDILKIFL